MASRSFWVDRPGLALLPPEFQPKAGAIILDIACGPGGWAIEVAHACPDVRVIGIDNDPLKINFAKSQAVALGIQNVEFLKGDMFELGIQDAVFLKGDAFEIPEHIEPASVDYLHARYLEWFIKDYAALLKQWINVLKPGGLLSITESEGPTTTSKAYNQLQRIFYEAMEKTRSKGLDGGERQVKTYYMYQWLLELHMSHIQEFAHVLNFSANVPDREYLARSNTHGMVSMKPLMIHSGIITSDEYDRLVQEATHDLWDKKFRANQFVLTVVGTKQ